MKSRVNAVVYQDGVEHFMLPSADKLHGEADFISQQDTYPHCQQYQNLVQWPWDYWAWLARKVACTEPHRDYGALPRGRWDTRPYNEMGWRMDHPGLPNPSAGPSNNLTFAWFSNVLSSPVSVTGQFRLHRSTTLIWYRIYIFIFSLPCRVSCLAVHVRGRLTSEKKIKN